MGPFPQKIYVILCCATLTLACQNSEFNGNNGKKVVATTSGSSPSAGEPTAQVFSGPANAPVDILFVMDTSGSMREEKKSLEGNMNRFLTNMLSAKLDVKILTLGGGQPNLDKFPRGGGNCGAFDFPKDLPKERFGNVPVYVHSYDPIGRLSNFLDGKYDSLSPFKLRKNAPLEIVIISDDDGTDQKELQQDPAETPRNLATDFKAPSGKKVRVHAIVGLENSAKIPEVCEIENPGVQAQTLANQTGGTIMDICSQDWESLINQLSSKIIAGNKGYQLEASIDPKKPVTILVNGKPLDSKLYTIDYAAGFITLSDGASVQSGDEIKVEYTPAK